MTTKNHAQRLDSICKIAAFSTAQAGKIEYFKILANAQNQRVSGFFTGDFF